MRETKIIAGLLAEQKSMAEIEEAIFNNNILQTNKIATSKRRYREINKRLAAINTEEIALLATGNYELSRLFNFYAILKINRLLGEFIIECLLEKVQLYQKRISNTEIKNYFDEKRKQSDIISGWSELTFNKTRQVTIKICLEAGLLIGKKTFLIEPAILPEQFTAMLIKSGNKVYLKYFLH